MEKQVRAQPSPRSCVSTSKGGDFVFAFPKVVQTHGPAVHHAAAFRQMLSAVISAPVRIAHCVRQLVFYEVASLPEYFVKQSTGYCPEAVRGQFIRPNARPAQSVDDGWLRGLRASRKLGNTN